MRVYEGDMYCWSRSSKARALGPGSAVWMSGTLRLSKSHMESLRRTPGEAPWMTCLAHPTASAEIQTSCVGPGACIEVTFLPSCGMGIQIAQRGEPCSAL